MTDDKHIDLSRRKVLGSLGAIGVASAGAGFGTSAYFNDNKSFDDNIMTAGTLDLLVDYYSYWNQGSAGSDYVSGTADEEAVSSDLSDVKPGDSGIVAFCPRIETNPAYLWLCGELTDSSENELTDSSENGYTEPEPEDDNGEGELEENIDVTVSYCTLNEIGDSFDPEDIESQTEIWSGTLAELLAKIRYGVPLDGDSQVSNEGFLEPGDQECFDGSNSKQKNDCICLDWEVPKSVGNEIQGDSLSFDLQFYAEQCRHNDGTRNPCNPFPNDPWLADAQTEKCGVFWNQSGENTEFPLEPGDSFDELPSPGQPIYVNTTDKPIEIEVDDGNSSTSVTLDVGPYGGSDFDEEGSNAPWVRIPTGIGTPYPDQGDNYEFVGIQETEAGCKVEWQVV